MESEIAKMQREFHAAQDVVEELMNVKSPTKADVKKFLDALVTSMSITIMAAIGAGDKAKGEHVLRVMTAAVVGMYAANPAIFGDSSAKDDIVEKLKGQVWGAG